jgi:hypothetical protein
MLFFDLYLFHTQFYALEIIGIVIITFANIFSGYAVFTKDIEYEINSKFK